MDCRALSPSSLPHTSKLIHDYVQHLSRLQNFYQHKPELHSAETYARQLNFPADRRREVAAILRADNLLFGSGPETENNLRRLENGAVAVVSGQQVGLFGGPAYAFYKALTAIESARELSLSGIEAVPIFWMATEYQDIDELRHTTWFYEGKLHKLVLPPPAEEARPAGRVPLGAEIEPLLQEIEDSLTGPSGFKLLEILRSCYTPQDTYGSAFAKPFAKLFSPHRLILLDPLDPSVHAIASPTQSQVIYQKLLGHMPVLLPRADYTLVDPKAVRILQKYNLKVEDAWLGPQTLRKRMYSTNVPKKLARSFDGSLRQIEKSIASLDESIRGVDPTIQGTIARAEKRIRYQVEQLRAKTGAALDRHEKIIELHAEFLENLLYPHKGLQSRDLSFLPFLLRLGSGGLGELQKLACAKKTGQHYIVSIP